MGAAQSNASNTANETNNISMNDNMACQATQVVNVGYGPVSVINSTFKDSFTANGVTAGQNASCSMQASMGAAAKNQADQATQQKTSAGPALAWSQSNSNNTINLQNNIEMSINATCGASQTTTVQTQAIVLNGDTFYGPVSLNDTNASQNFSCVLDLAQQADAGNTSSQTNKQKTSSHISAAFAMVLIVVLLVIFAVIFGAPLMMMKAPAKIATSIGSGPKAAATRLAAAKTALAEACAQAQANITRPGIDTARKIAKCPTT
jgi:hypothetical protein